MDSLPLTYISSVQLVSLSNAVPQVQDRNEIIYGHVCNISDIFITFFSNIDSLITTRSVFSAFCILFYL